MMLYTLDLLVIGYKIFLVFHKNMFIHFKMLQWPYSPSLQVTCNHVTQSQLIILCFKSYFSF